MLTGGASIAPGGALRSPMPGDEMTESANGLSSGIACTGPSDGMGRRRRSGAIAGGVGAAIAGAPTGNGDTGIGDTGNGDTGIGDPGIGEVGIGSISVGSICNLGSSTSALRPS